MPTKLTSFFAAAALSKSYPCSFKDCATTCLAGLGAGVTKALTAFWTSLASLGDVAFTDDDDAPANGDCIIPGPSVAIGLNTAAPNKTNEVPRKP